MPSPRDPFGLADLTTQTLRTTADIVVWSQRRIVSLLRSRLEATQSSSEVAESLDTKLHRLLEEPGEQTVTSSRQQLFHGIVDQLVPDEARILAALADRSTSPLVHVYAPAESGLMDEVVLENMALVGRTANLALPHLTPTYVSHLLSLGLVETGPEDESLDYDLLEQDASVARAVKKATRGPLDARVDRHTLRLSGLGLELWAAANPDRSLE
jgi:hypothetical protein